jgi:hypothetical protein
MVIIALLQYAIASYALAQQNCLYISEFHHANVTVKTIAYPNIGPG